MEINNGDIYLALRRRFTRADDADINDAVAVAHVATWEARETGVALRNVNAFATCVAKRAIGRQIRRSVRNVYPDRDEATTWDRVTTITNSLEVLEDHATNITAHDVVETAPEKYSEVLRLHYLEGYTLNEAAECAGVTPECMRKRHERALKWARKKLSGG